MNKDNNFLYFLICGGALVGYLAYKINKKKDEIMNDIWDW